MACSAGGHFHSKIGKDFYMGRKSLKPRELHVVSMIVAIWVWASFTDLAVAAPTKIDLNYEQKQTYSGTAYVKDDHIWIYTKAFAERFDMPKAWISEELKGIEAAAFRIGEGDFRCGLGRNPDSCARFQECQLDIYVDEKKYPLPWLTDKAADWLPGPDSFKFLYDADRNLPGLAQPPAGIEGDIANMLHPFGDWQTKRPAYYMQNAQTPDDDSLNIAIILAYQRRIHGDLTMIRLNYGNLTRNKRPFTSFWLVLESKNWIGNMRKFPQKIYHHFQLPAAFESRIDEVRANRNKIEEQKYQQILKMK